MISIIVPIYNAEKYLDRCIESIVKQTYKDLEIILVNDGSPDSCCDICDKWAKKDNRIVVIHKTNGGLSDARNVGLKKASGEFVSFVDDDDFISFDMYQKMHDILKSENADIVICRRCEYKNKKRVGKIKKNISQFKVYNNVDAIGELLSGKNFDESAWGKLYKKEIFTFEFPYGEKNEDIITIPKVFENAKRIVLINEALYHYWRHENSMTTDKNYNNKLIVRKHIEDVSHFFLKKYPQLIKEISVFKGRYSLSQLFSFYEEPKLREDYREYYEYYLSNLKENILILLLSNKISIKRKMQILMIVFGFYKYYRMLRKA